MIFSYKLLLTDLISCVFRLIEYEIKIILYCTVLYCTVPGGAGVVVAGDDVAAGSGGRVAELEVDPLPGGAQGAVRPHHLRVSSQSL